MFKIITKQQSQVDEDMKVTDSNEVLFNSFDYHFTDIFRFVVDSIKVPSTFYLTRPEISRATK